MKCPHCNKKDFIPTVLYRNVENYDGTGGVIKCLHCKKTVEIYAGRTVEIYSAYKANKNKADWPDSSMEG